MSKNVTIALLFFIFFGGYTIHNFVNELIGEWMIWIGGLTLLSIQIFEHWKKRHTVYLWIFSLLFLFWLIGFSYFIY